MYSYTFGFIVGLSYKEHDMQQFGTHESSKYRTVTCKRTARQRLDEYPSIQARNNGTTGLCNLLLDNGSVNIYPRRCNDVTLQQNLAIT
jgi:hypothetical protein